VGEEYDDFFKKYGKTESEEENERRIEFLR